MVVNELIDLTMKTKRFYLIFKADFEKVYDLVNLSFLGYILLKFGFNN